MTADWVYDSPPSCMMAELEEFDTQGILADPVGHARFVDEHGSGRV